MPMPKAFGCEGADVVVPPPGQLSLLGQLELFVQLQLVPQFSFSAGQGQSALEGQVELFVQEQLGPQFVLLSNTPNPPRNLPSLLSPSGLKSPSKSVFRDFFLSFIIFIFCYTKVLYEAIFYR